ncbi:GPI ethanolamine phosphate transferase 3 [Orchesella cincta]|uniref:GPI ethanolamine phosphate transferase 3 n=1 Tax=Orchesella cincta TaxID=48709 RepID=A0A1D2MVS7_ORCCI|nr:GPI ethanolamine phosphate transferase 3 [Orchesella cincta]
MDSHEHHHRRNMSKIQTISVISFLSFSVIVGTLVFSRGFLLNRQIIPDKAGPCLDTAYRQRDQFYHEQGEHLGQQLDGVELLSNLSESASWCNPSPVFKKAVLILVDALRYDFVSRMTFLSSIVTDKDKLKDNNEQHKNHKSVTSSTKNVNGNRDAAAGGSYHEGPGWESSSCLFRFVADPPTTTMQRLKALMTGTMPTFIDASANFNSYEVEEDSLIYQLNAMGKKLAFLGDDTWLSLFPPSYFKSPVVEAHPSFNAWDLDTVDRAVNHSLRNKVFGREAEKEWDVLIAHLLGVDHCGHRYGPSHPEMVRKLREADEIIEFVFNSMSQDTLLVVFGDHGMTPTGDHGGDSKDETDAAVVFLSKAIKQRRNIRGEINSGSLHSASFQCPSYSSSISQIDLVPTLATLLGTPIPYSSIGQLIPNFIGKKGVYSDAVSANVAQVERYLRKFGIVGSISKSSSSGGGHGLEEEYLHLQEAFHSYQLSRTNQSSRAKLNALAHKYLNRVKFIAVSTWTQFNVPMIYCGVAISSLACFSLFVYLNHVRSLLSSRRKHKYSVLSWLWPSLPLWSVCVTFFQDKPSPATNLWNVIVSTLSGLIMFLLALGMKLIQKMGEEEEEASSSADTASSSKRKSGWNFCDLGALSIYMLTCLAMFSNSFVINEGYMLGSALLLVVFLYVLTSPSNLPRRSNNTMAGDQARGSEQHHPLGVVGGKDEWLLVEILCRKSTKCSLVCFVTLAALVRICSIFFRCREELTECTEEYLLHKQLSSLPEDWQVHKYVRYSVALVSLAIFVVAFRLWMLYQKCLFSKRPAAIVAKFIPSLLVVLLGVLWALQGLPLISSSAAKLRPILNYFPWVFQASTFISLVIVWVKPIVSGGGAGQSLLLPSHFQVGCSRCSQASAGKKRAESIGTSSPAAVGNNNAVIWSKPNVNASSNYSSTVHKPTLHKNNSGANGVNKKVNGLQKLCDQISMKNQPKRDQKRVEQLSKSVFLEMEQQKYSLEDSGANGSYSCSILVFATLVIVLMAQITSAGLTPAVAIVIPYSIICLVGIYRSKNLSVSSPTSHLNSDGDSWGGVVAWALCSQYLFYGTGHQPIFSAIPWDSAFLTTTDGTSFTDASGSWLTWVRPALAIIGNLHVSQITFSLALPLLAYWSNETPLNCHHQCHAKRRKAYILCGKYILLHGIKLLACMACAGWHRATSWCGKYLPPSLSLKRSPSS